MKHLPLVLAATLALTACSSAIQTTSGAAYLSDSRGTIDASIKAAADIEPDLRLPARIGLARVVNGKLTAIPGREADRFAHLAEKHDRMGEFIPVSPLVAGMIQNGLNRNTIQNIRQASARQHLDYVIIYEVGARSNTTNTPFALADITLIGGMLLPTRKIEATGICQAIFMDVRSGYPYATVGETHDLTGFGRTFATRTRSAELRALAVDKVVKAMVPQLDEMLAGITERAGKR